MPIRAIRKYPCQYCVTAVCEACGWVKLNRPKVHFVPCIDCGAEWWTLRFYPSKHRSDHKHLNMNSQQASSPTPLLAPGEKRKRGRPRKAV